MLGELRRPRDDLAVRRGDHRVAVEDQLVLRTDQVDVGNRRTGLGGPTGDQRRAHVILGALVRRTIEANHEVYAHFAQRRHRAAVLPDVLADDHAHVHAVQPHDRQGGAGREVARLVEHAVVRQLVFVVGRDDLAAVEQRRRVAWAFVVAVQVTDHDQRIPAARILQAPGERLQFGEVRGGEGLTQREVLDGIAGKHHFRENDQVSTVLDCPASPVQDHRTVAGDITDACVDLCECDTQLGHALIFTHATARCRARCEPSRSDHVTIQ